MDNDGLIKKEEMLKWQESFIESFKQVTRIGFRNKQGTH